VSADIGAELLPVSWILSLLPLSGLWMRSAHPEQLLPKISKSLSLASAPWPSAHCVITSHDN